MSIVRRKALVNYKVSYTTVFGYPGFYECTKLMWCDMFGNVTENTLDTWTAVLEDEETKKLDERTYSHGQENEGKVAELNVVVTGFTKLDLN
jgi:hypothetical protein